MYSTILFPHKVLLYRSSTPEAAYHPVNVASFNQDLFLLCWSPAVAALSYVFENAEQEAVVQKTIYGFRSIRVCISVPQRMSFSDYIYMCVLLLCYRPLCVGVSLVSIHWENEFWYVVECAGWRFLLPINYCYLSN